jgi:hypothetical protein
MKMSLRKTLASMPVLVVLAALAAGVWAPTPCRAAASILIKPDSPRSVTGKDDVQQLKRLISSTDYEFDPNAATTAECKRIGIRTIRCINVDLAGTFDKDGKFIISDSARLDWHLDGCRALGAVPHVVIACGVPADLQVKEADVPDQYKALIHGGAMFGPTDWTKFRAYCEAYFEYVMITKGFTNAEFEVGNEPDISGGLYPFPPKPAMGSRALYEAAFNLYKNVAEAAVSFEAKHPGVPVKLGGLALAWAYSFLYGDFNWAEHFIRDCGEQEVKLDFISVHYYGNTSSLDGEYPSGYPPFTGMLRTTQAAIDKYYPGLPIQITEWGGTYNGMGNSPDGRFNANNVGTAFGAAFLNTMLGCGVDKAFYLVTTDLRINKQGQEAEGAMIDEWSWPALFLDTPLYGGKALPKPIFHLFEMVSQLQGQRVEASRGNRTVNCFVAADPDQRKITMLVWNYGAILHETGPETETAVTENTAVHVLEAGSFFHTPQVMIGMTQVNKDTDNIYQMMTTGVVPDEKNTAVATLPTQTAQINQGALDFSVVLPPSSVSLVTLTETP